MKLLSIGDLHIQKKNLRVFKEFEKQLHVWLKKSASSIDGIVVLGDVLHTMDVINSLCLNTALDFFKALQTYSLPIYVLVGNHDFIGPNEFMSKNHWMSSICTHSNIKVIDYATAIDHDIIMCPYVPPGRFHEALLLADKHYTSKKVIFCHQEFHGVQFESTNIKSDKGDHWDTGSPLIVAGHIHKKQWLGQNIYYVGTPYQTRFNEDLNKSIAIVDTKTGNVLEVYLETPKLISIAEHIENEEVLSGLKFDDNNLYKIVLESPSIVHTNAMIKKSVYKRLKALKNVTILFVYPKTQIKLEESAATTDKPLEFKMLLYENIKHNDNMIQMYNDLIQC